MHSEHIWTAKGSDSRKYMADQCGTSLVYFQCKSTDEKESCSTFKSPFLRNYWWGCTELIWAIIDNVLTNWHWSLKYFFHSLNAYWLGRNGTCCFFFEMAVLMTMHWEHLYTIIGSYPNKSVAGHWCFPLHSFNVNRWGTFTTSTLLPRYPLQCTNASLNQHKNHSLTKLSWIIHVTLYQQLIQKLFSVNKIHPWSTNPAKKLVLWFLHQHNTTLCKIMFLLLPVVNSC